MDWNIRGPYPLLKILEAHTIKMLEAKIFYWKNRAKIRWATLGDENSKKIHTVATRSNRKNLITSIFHADANEIFNHDHKAAIIWASYRNRLGISENSIIHYQMGQIVQSYNLSHLDNPFTYEEIEDVVKEMHTDRSPGPDGFNEKFLKKMLVHGQELFYQTCQ
jgi:hypothetical protein